MTLAQNALSTGIQAWSVETE